MRRGSRLSRRRTRQEEAEEEEQEEEEATDIKSNNPHLAGGEKQQILVGGLEHKFIQILFSISWEFHHPN